MAFPDAGTLSSAAWRDLFSLTFDPRSEPSYLLRLLELWAEARGVAGAALYLEQQDQMRCELRVGEGSFPRRLDPSAPLGEGSVRLPGGLLLHAPGSPLPGEVAADPLLLLLGTGLELRRLRQQLKEQRFQVSYRGVELEALYDVGLAIASTLDMEQVSEEILLRAVSLLDARRGALYFAADGRYRLDRTFGGEARPSFVAVESIPEDLLPGVRHLLALPIEIEGRPRGLLVVGDKESRRGVGPFEPEDERTLSLFANQAAIALENARLHRQALEKERMEREMELAAEIQRRILPKESPELAGFELYGWSRPARQVGGDYYDLLPLGEGRCRLALGDVSGKGMPAALLVSTLHSALRLLADQLALGPALFDRLNQHLLESSASNKFVTLFVGEIDTGTGVLRYVNAGHNPPLLLRASGEVARLGSGGLPVGILRQGSYRLDTDRLEDGELLCIYSDGITEAPSPDDEEFGVERLRALLETHRRKPLPEVVGAIDSAVTEFGGGLAQGDDATLVLLRRRS